ncbi:unnamed protein product [Ectocarpus sp. 12 AP-2014]
MKKKRANGLLSVKQSDSRPEKRLEIRAVLSPSKCKHPRHGRRSAVFARFQRENSRAVTAASWSLEIRGEDARFSRLKARPLSGIREQCRRAAAREHLVCSPLCRSHHHY